MSDLTIEGRRRLADSTAGIASAWDRRLRSAPSWHLPATRTVVVVPHPDDESLSSGGLILRQTARGVPVIVVAVTDGEAAYTTWSPPGLAATRREEQRTALDMLGVPAVATIRLGLRDGAVAAHQDELTARLDDIVEPGDVLVAPWSHDWHPDHVACGRAAEDVAHSRVCTLVGSLFWAYHRVDPRDRPDVGIAALRLTEDESVWRWAAVQSHLSQFEAGDQPPILDASLIERLREPVEHYVVTP